MVPPVIRTESDSARTAASFHLLRFELVIKNQTCLGSLRRTESQDSDRHRKSNLAILSDESACHRQVILRLHVGCYEAVGMWIAADPGDCCDEQTQCWGMGRICFYSSMKTHCF
jgi:hypothetical protein